MTLRIIAAAILTLVVVVVVAGALYFTVGRGDSETDSGLITFTSDRDGDGEIDERNVMNLDESSVRPLTRDEESGMGERTTNVFIYPSGNTLAHDEVLNRSPDGWRVFASDQDGDFEIYVMTPDVSGVTLLTHNETSNEYTYLTSGGVRTIKSGGVFMQHFGPDYGADYGDIGAVTQLTHNGANDNMASWAPDGRIWFISDRDGDAEIYVMNSDGSSVTQLTHNEAHDSAPIWSPDGRRIVFTSNRDGDYEIYVMNPDGSGVRQLTHNEVDDFATGWLPEPSAAP